jgi:solute carrier family 25 folate transporter 32
MTAGGSKQDAAVDESSALRSLLAGAGAGVICTLLCAPLDVTKVRLQVQGTLGGKNRYSGGIYSSLRKIYTEEGFRGVFKGVGPALVTVPLFWGVYWPIYDKMKSHFGSRDSGVSSSTGHILSAVVAGATSDVITNPFWVTRTRIQTLALHSEVPVSAEISTVQMMKHIYETEGWTAFYKGLGASFLGLSHVAIQFPLCKNPMRAENLCCVRSLTRLPSCNQPTDEYLKREARRGEDRPETVSATSSHCATTYSTIHGS